MKKTILLSLLAVFVCSLTFIEDNPIQGKWNHVFKDGGPEVDFLVNFRADGSYDGFANKKSFVTGTYHMKHDTLYISDPVCNSRYEGTYKVTIFGKQDSVKFQAIQDTCKGRYEGVNGLFYKRVK